MCARQRWISADEKKKKIILLFFMELNHVAPDRSKSFGVGPNDLETREGMQASEK